MKGFLKSFRPFLKLFNKRKLEFSFLGIALFTSIISAFIFFSQNEEQEIDEITTSSEETPRKIYVDLSGSVVKPDVYQVASGTRMKEVIDQAKGLTDEADKVFFARNFNLAKILSDQEKIYIPSFSEINAGIFSETSEFLVNTADSDSNSLLIDINSASTEELDTLDGVGKVTAEKIINNRPYTNIKDLLNKKIVKKNVWEKIKDYIMVE